jgi:hypothetical protein
MTPTSQEAQQPQQSENVEKNKLRFQINELLSLPNDDLLKTDANPSTRIFERGITKDLEKEINKIRSIILEFESGNTEPLYQARGIVFGMIGRVNTCPFPDDIFDIQRSRMTLFLEAKNNCMKVMMSLIKELDSAIETQEVISAEKSKLIAAATNVITVLSCNSERYGYYKNRKPFDIMIRREAQGIFNSCTMILREATDFYFDKVNLPTWLLSPELMTVISNRVFTRDCTDGKYTMKLRPEYEMYRYLAPLGSPHLDPRACIPLSNELLACCLKFMDKTHKYAPLGNSQYESLEQQIENFIVSGRADRVVSEGPTGPGPEDTAHIILKEANKSISTRRVLIGSFPLGDSIPDKQSDNPGKPRRRWIRVIVD